MGWDGMGWDGLGVELRWSGLAGLLAVPSNSALLAVFVSLLLSSLLLGKRPAALRVFPPTRRPLGRAQLAGQARARAAIRPLQETTQPPTLRSATTLLILLLLLLPPCTIPSHSSLLCCQRSALPAHSIASAQRAATPPPHALPPVAHALALPAPRPASQTDPRRPATGPHPCWVKLGGGGNKLQTAVRPRAVKAHVGNSHDHTSHTTPPRPAPPPQAFTHASRVAEQMDLVMVTSVLWAAVKLGYTLPRETVGGRA